MKNKSINRRQLLVVTSLFEVAIFGCDIANVLLLPEIVIKLAELVLFAVIFFVTLYSLNKESKMVENFNKKSKEIRAKAERDAQADRQRIRFLEKRLGEREREFFALQDMALRSVKSDASPQLIKQLAANKTKRIG